MKTVKKEEHINNEWSMHAKIKYLKDFHIYVIKYYLPIWITETNLLFKIG